MTMVLYLIKWDIHPDKVAIQASLGWDKKARTLGWFGLRDGM